jgi:4-hydroxybenzoate polyprenyltransferase
MNLEWIAQKGMSLTAIVVGLAFLAVAFFEGQYRYFWLCVAIVFFVGGYRQFRKRHTPFERREREIRRKTM